MFCINLDKLKIQKEFNYQTYTVEMSIDPTLPAAKIKAQALETLKGLFIEKPSIAALYVVNIDSPTADEEDFESLVNILSAAFLELFTINKGRPREHRLDVPKPLQCANMSMFAIKKMVNSQTITDVFNFTINCNDLSYVMIDTKNASEVQDE